MDCREARSDKSFAIGEEISSPSRRFAVPGREDCEGIRNSETRCERIRLGAADELCPIDHNGGDLPGRPSACLDLCSTGRNGPKPCGRYDVIYFLGPQELAEIRDHGRWDEQHRLAEVSYPLPRHESGIAIHFLTAVECVPKDEATNPRTLGRVAAVNVPRNDEPITRTGPLLPRSLHRSSIRHDYAQLGITRHDVNSSGGGLRKCSLIGGRSTRAPRPCSHDRSGRIRPARTARRHRPSASRRAAPRGPAPPSRRA